MLIRMIRGSINRDEIKWFFGLFFFVLISVLIIPFSAQADILASRSIKLGTPAKDAAEVAYSVKFKAAQNNTSAFVIDFCENSPVIEDGCDEPDGFTVNSNPTAVSGEIVTRLSPHTVLVELSEVMDAGDEISIELNSFNNPVSSGTIYARIVTYESIESAEEYLSGSPGNFLDSGSVAILITDEIGMGGTVQETLTFCASANELDNDGCKGVTVPPDITLGDENKILGPDRSEASVYTLISTNAPSGAVVSLKSNSVGCGGLLLSGSEVCGILPQTEPSSISSGSGRFGLKLASLSARSGAIDAMNGYSTDNFLMNFSENNQIGVTSFMGDPIFNTNNAPLIDGKVELVFAANTGPNTPAGDYYIRLNLVATGKY